MTNLLIGIHNKSFFDSYWVAIHFASGLLTGLALLYIGYKTKTMRKGWFFRIGISLLLLWEYFELSLRYINRYSLSVYDFLHIIIPNNFFDIESVVNVMSDLIVGFLGLLLVYLYSHTKSSPPS